MKEVNTVNPNDGATEPTAKALARHAIGQLLDGHAPNGLLPDTLGYYGECYAEMKRAYQQGGTPAARQIFATYADHDYEIAALRAADLKPQLKAQPFTPLTYLELLQQPIKEWHMHNLFGPQDLGMIYGPAGSGKTFVVIDLIVSACLGEQFANRFESKRPLNVAYCAGEGLSGLPARFAAAAEAHAVEDLPNLYFYNIAPQLFESNVGPTLAQFTEQWQQGQSQPLDLLVIDTLHSAILGADENSSRDMGKVLASVKDAAKRLGCAVLLVHHSNKAGTGERGSSALRGAMDFIIEVKPCGEKYSMSCAKLKEAEQWSAQSFALIPQANSVALSWGGAVEKGQSQSRRSEATSRTVFC